MVGRTDLLALPPRLLLANAYPFRPGEQVGPHCSESELVLLTTRGEGTVKVGTTQYQVRAASVVHVPWAVEVSYRCARGPWTVIGLHLAYAAWTQGPLPPPNHHRRDAGPGIGGPWWSERPASPLDGMGILHPGRRWGHLLDTAREAIDVYDQPQSDRRELMMRAMAMTLIEALCKCRDGDDLAAAPEVADLISWMLLDLSRPMGREILVRRSGLSATSLADRFLEATGATALGHLRELRLERARSLVVGSQETISTIARDVGIPDVQYFSRLFRRRFGLSPGRYRRCAHGP